MFGVFFSILALVALVSIFGEIVMGVRLTRRETSRDKLVWWRRGGDEVARPMDKCSHTTESRFSSASPPGFFVAWSGVVVLSMLLRKSS
jgi:hypothetical protein